MERREVDQEAGDAAAKFLAGTLSDCFGRKPKLVAGWL